MFRMYVMCNYCYYNLLDSLKLMFYTSIIDFKTLRCAFHFCWDSHMLNYQGLIVCFF
jgi:hypothetical protein